MLYCCNIFVYVCCRDIGTIITAAVCILVVTAVLLVLFIPVTLALKEFLL